MATLQALPEDQQRAEIESFVSKLPYSPDTLALQERAQQLGESLPTATPEESQALLDELAKISAALDGDPVIKKVQNDLVSLTGYGINGDGTTPSLSSMKLSSLQRGDILARRSWFGAVFPWSMKYEHTGNFDGNSQVYESNLDGVTLRPLTEWTRCCQYVGFARNTRVSSTSMASAVDWAKNKYGTNGRTPYNFNFPNKWTDGSLYCSQLTWKINKQVGYNLDSNHWLYRLTMSIKYSPLILLITDPAVAPDEVMLSPYLTILGEGWY